MYCFKCGKEIRTDATFCPFCGEKVESLELSSQDYDKGNGSATIIEQLDIITCPICGEKVKEDAFVCPNCGTVLKQSTSYNTPAPSNDTNGYKFWNGRLDRKRYFAISILLFLPFSIAISAWQQSGNTVGLFVGIVLYVLWLIASIRRCHDFDSSGFMCVLLFIPIISFFFCLYLLFKRGTLGSNGYGTEQS